MEHCKNGHIRSIDNTHIRKNGAKCCRVCHRDRERERLHRSLEARQQNRDRSNKWRQDNPLRYKESRKAYRKHYRETIDSYKTECKLCGESVKACLDFHHRDPNEKSFNIGIRFGKVSLDRIIEEIKKCDVLCANCHRKHHATERLG